MLARKSDHQKDAVDVQGNALPRLRMLGRAVTQHANAQAKTGIRSGKGRGFAHDCIHKTAHNRQKTARETEHARRSGNQSGNNLITHWLPWLGMT